MFGAIKPGVIQCEIINTLNSEHSNICWRIHHMYVMSSIKISTEPSSGSTRTNIWTNSLKPSRRWKLWASLSRRSYARPLSPLNSYARTTERERPNTSSMWRLQFDPLAMRPSETRCNKQHEQHEECWFVYKLLMQLIRSWGVKLFRISVNHEFLPVIETPITGENLGIGHCKSSQADFNQQTIVCPNFT